MSGLHVRTAGCVLIAIFAADSSAWAAPPVKQIDKTALIALAQARGADRGSWSDEGYAVHPHQKHSGGTGHK